MDINRKLEFKPRVTMAVVKSIGRIVKFTGKWEALNLKEADVIFCFLMPETMEKLKIKLEKELKPGVRVISFAFEIKGWTPQTVIKEKQKLTAYIYLKG